MESVELLQIEKEIDTADILAAVGIGLSVIALFKNTQNGVNGLPGKQGIQGLQGIPGVNGTNGINGTNGANGSAGPGSTSHATIIAAGAPVLGTTLFLVDSLTTSTLTGLCRRVWAPANSTWKVGVASDAIIAGADILTATIYTGTLNGVYAADVASAATVANADGIGLKEGATFVMPASGWMAVAVTYSNAIALGVQTYAQLRRLT